ncbi:hypothetical protein AAVH_08972 [Aphelenchoides avenae]|nr:hypothetical protein AAVH_08972 [Aphelenchus avenae]
MAAVGMRTSPTAQQRQHMPAEMHTLLCGMRAADKVISFTFVERATKGGCRLTLARCNSRKRECHGGVRAVAEKAAIIGKRTTQKRHDEKKYAQRHMQT